LVGGQVLLGEEDLALVCRLDKDLLVSEMDVILLACGVGVDALACGLDV